MPPDHALQRTPVIPPGVEGDKVRSLALDRPSIAARWLRPESWRQSTSVDEPPDPPAAAESDPELVETVLLG